MDETSSTGSDLAAAGCCALAREKQKLRASATKPERRFAMGPYSSPLSTCRRANESCYEIETGETQEYNASHSRTRKTEARFIPFLNESNHLRCGSSSDSRRRSAFLELRSRGFGLELRPACRGQCGRRRCAGRHPRPCFLEFPA